VEFLRDSSNEVSARYRKVSSLGDCTVVSIAYPTHFSFPEIWKLKIFGWLKIFG